MKQIICGNTGNAVLVDDDDFERFGHHNYTEDKYGYAYRRGAGFMHREILNAPPGVSVDHINMVKRDNRKCNLRLSDRHEQARRVTRSAARKLPGPVTTYRGVSYGRPRPRPWRATLVVQRKRYYLGYFATDVEAAHAYDAAVREHLGERWWINFPTVAEPVPGAVADPYGLQREGPEPQRC